jgi:hypothetical protein
MRARLWILTLAVALASSALTGAPAQADVPGTTCKVFPPDNVWHLNVSGLPVHAKSRTWKRATHAAATRASRRPRAPAIHARAGRLAAE